MSKKRCRYCGKPCRPERGTPRRWWFCARCSRVIDLDEKGNMYVINGVLFPS